MEVPGGCNSITIFDQDEELLPSKSFSDSQLSTVTIKLPFLVEAGCLCLNIK